MATSAANRISTILTDGALKSLKELYRRLAGAGKSPKIAITVVMRKLIIFANALLSKGRKWDEKTACP